MSKRILKKLFLLITSCFLFTACGKSGQEAVNTYGFEKYSYRYVRDYIVQKYRKQFPGGHKMGGDYDD